MRNLLEKIDERIEEILDLYPGYEPDKIILGTERLRRQFQKEVTEDLGLKLQKEVSSLSVNIKIEKYKGIEIGYGDIEDLALPFGMGIINPFQITIIKTANKES